MGAEPRDVLKLTLSGAGEELIATRKDADAGWTYAVGSAPPQAVAGRTLDDFLDRLRWLRAESLEADAAPAAPAARTVVLSGAAGELGRIDFLEDPSAPATASAPAALERGDTESVVDALADKTLALRVFLDEGGKMNRSLLDVAGEILVVSQFTLA